MRESAVAWSWFEVLVPRQHPTKQHPDVQCRKCGKLLKNAQLSATVLPHAGYKCERATTDMIDTARRLIYQATVRSADRGSKAARTKLLLGEAGEPNWRKRHMRMHPWIEGYPSSDEEFLDDFDKPPPAKKARKKTVAASVGKKKAAATASATDKETATAPSKQAAAPPAFDFEFEFSAKAMDKENGTGFMIAEAFHSLGVPFETIDNPIFRSIIKAINPNVSLPSRTELETVLS